MSNIVELHNWYATHPEARRKYIGKWVAVVTGRIVAGARSLKALLRKPEVQAVRSEALFTKVLTRKETEQLLFHYH